MTTIKELAYSHRVGVLVGPPSLAGSTIGAAQPDTVRRGGFVSYVDEGVQRWGLLRIRAAYESAGSWSATALLYEADGGLPAVAPRNDKAPGRGYEQRAEVDVTEDLRDLAERVAESQSASAAQNARLIASRYRARMQGDERSFQVTVTDTSRGSTLVATDGPWGRLSILRSPEPIAEKLASGALPLTVDVTVDEDAREPSAHASRATRVVIFAHVQPPQRG